MRMSTTSSSSSSGAERSVEDAAAMCHHQRVCTDNNTCSTATTNFASYLEAVPTFLESHFIHDVEQQKTTTNDVVFQITMGNEAGDADSIVSALALSFVDHGAGGGGGYHYNHATNNDKVDEQQESTAVSTNVEDIPRKNSIVVPVPLVSIPRDDFPLRRDVVLLLEMAGVNCEKLLFLRDEEMTQIMRTVQHKRNVRNEWTLVDHNKFRSDLDIVGDVKVVEILDHHQDEGAHEMVEKEKRNIAFENQSALVGSTCTLVTERLMKRYFQQENDNQVDAGLGLALLGVILLDTMNMSKEAAKGTARDEVAIDFLLARTDWSALNVTKKKEWKEALGFETNNDTGLAVPSRSRLYEFLQNCKFDVDFWTSMSPKDALRIDYKRFETKASEGGVGPVSFGLSSVLLDMPTLLSKPNFYTEALAYMKQVNVTLLGVLTMTIVNDKPKREMLLLGDKQRVDEMTDFLLHNDAAASLKISKAEDDFHVELDNHTMAAVHLKQGNPKGSRKQVAPVMLAGMK